MNELFDERVKLTKEGHIYHHRDGRIFTSLSKVREVIKPVFNKDQHIFSAGKGKYVDMSPEQVKSQWKKTNTDACDTGTMIHDSLELYGLTAQVLPENEWLRPMIISVSATEKDYYAIYREKTLYNEEFGIAATADRILATTRHKESILEIDDYKTNLSKGIYFTCKYKNYLKGPFSHLQNSNYYDYTLQLSTEALFLEELTGRKIGKLSITYIPPNNPLAWRIIPVTYVKNDAKILLNYYKELKHIKSEEGESITIYPNINNAVTPNFI